MLKYFQLVNAAERPNASLQRAATASRQESGLSRAERGEEPRAVLRVVRNTAPAAHAAHRSRLGRSNWPIADDTRVPQSEALLVNMRKRRRALNRHIGLARCLSNQSGWLQLYQFELQGLQPLMQSDAMRLEVLMSAYKQREKMYEVQMTEARRVSDTKQPGALIMGAVPFTPDTTVIA